MNWWDQDLSRWPGPDTNSDILAPGTIMAHRGDPHTPIGILMSSSDGYTVIQHRTEATPSNRDSLSTSFYESDLVPYSAG